VVVSDLEDENDWGYWYSYNDGTAGSMQTPTNDMFTAEPGGPDGTGFAMHTVGGTFSTWGAGVGLQFDACHDIADATGVTFFAKGPGHVVLSMPTAGVIPVAEGGSCVPNSSGSNCYDTHKFEMDLGLDWMEYNVPFSEVKQAGWGTKVPFHPAEIADLQFVVLPEDTPFDFWIDEVRLAGIDGVRPEVVAPTSLADLLTEGQFNQMFPDRDAFYTYAGLIAAADTFPAFVNEGDLDTRKREVAALLANVAHETGRLVHIHELSPPSIYCMADEDYPCVPGQDYHGRGPIQLSWNYNYGPAGDYIDADLLNNPNLVATDARISWQTGIWFWMTAGQNSETPHEAIVNNEGFGQTIQLINGGQECNGGPAADRVALRVSYYNEFCAILGVDPGGNLTC
jgi:predicted chitinase